MGHKETISELMSLIEYDSNKGKQTFKDALDLFQRNFAFTSKSHLSDILSAHFPEGSRNISKHVLENSNVIVSFYKPIKKDLFIMDVINKKHFTNKDLSHTESETNGLEKSVDILENLSDFF